MVVDFLLLLHYSFFHFPPSPSAPLRGRSRRWSHTQPSQLLATSSKTVPAQRLANANAQRTMGKLLNPYFSKREPPGTDDERERSTLQSPRSWLLIINLRSPPSFHGGTWKPCLRQTKQQIHTFPLITLGKWESGYYVQGLLKILKCSCNYIPVLFFFFFSKTANFFIFGLLAQWLH